MAKSSKRRGRKPKTLEEKRIEFNDNLRRVLRVSEVFHNAQRNKTTRHRSKMSLHKYERQMRRSRDPEEKRTLGIIINDLKETVTKMEAFVTEDSAFIKKEIGNIRFVGAK